MRFTMAIMFVDDRRRAPRHRYDVANAGKYRGRSSFTLGRHRYLASNAGSAAVESFLSFWSNDTGWWESKGIKGPLQVSHGLALPF